jgi:hypothetical protein
MCVSTIAAIWAVNTLIEEFASHGLEILSPSSLISVLVLLLIPTLEHERGSGIKCIACRLSSGNNLILHHGPTFHLSSPCPLASIDISNHSIFDITAIDILVLDINHSLDILQRPLRHITYSYYSLLFESEAILCLQKIFFHLESAIKNIK